MEKLDQKAVWIFFFKSLGIGLVLAFIFTWIFRAVFEVLRVSFGWWIIIFCIIWIFGSYFWAKLSYNVYKFELAEDAFKKEYGVIWKKYVSIPYERIQNVNIQRGIIARILGLSELMIQTAGYAGVAGGGIYTLGGREPEGYLPGLSKERAEQLREELIKRAKGTKSGL